MGLFSGIIGGIGGLVGGRRQARAERENSERSAALVREGRDLAFNESGLGAFRDAGLDANETFQSALGIGGDPAAADAAFARFQDNTGFRRQLRTGQEAIGAGAAAAGKFNSGATGRALVEFGQDTGRRSFNDFLSQVGSAANRGLNASSNLAGAATGSAANEAQITQTGGQRAAAANNRGFQELLGGVGAAAEKIF